MIPEEKKTVVARALHEAFGATEYEDIRILTAGLSSALVFRIVVKDRPYLLRVITRTDAMNDPTRQFTCMRASAEAGLAPRIWYTSIEDRVSITDFVDARPFPVAEVLVRLPATLRMLHALPPFPNTVNYLEAMAGFINKFHAAKILPESETSALLQLHARVMSAYPRNDADIGFVSQRPETRKCPLRTGTASGSSIGNRPSSTTATSILSVVANFVIITEADEELFLRTYFGEPPTQYQHARFYLMRQILHMSSAAVFFLIGSAGKPVEPDANVLSFRDFHSRVWSGEISVAPADTKLQYARVHLNQLFANAGTPRFQDGLQIVSATQGASQAQTGERR